MAEYPKDVEMNIFKCSLIMVAKYMSQFKIKKLSSEFYL